MKMSDIFFDYLVINLVSFFYDVQVLECGVGVCFNDVECDNVEEYLVSEGWICVQVGKVCDCRGNLMIIKVKGKVEVYFLDQKLE